MSTIFTLVFGKVTFLTILMACKKTGHAYYFGRLLFWNDVLCNQYWLLLLTRQAAMVAEFKTIRTKIFHRRILSLLFWGEVQRISSMFKQEFHVLAYEPVMVFMSTILALFFRPPAFSTALMARI